MRDVILASVLLVDAGGSSRILLPFILASAVVGSVSLALITFVSCLLAPGVGLSVIFASVMVVVLASVRLMSLI